MITIRCEKSCDVPGRDILLDAAMGPQRTTKASEKLRKNRVPADGLAWVAEAPDGQIIGTVRLWQVMAGGVPALLLGPLAVAPDCHGSGVGTRLMRMAIAEAAWRGHGAILLVGDAPYYARFGFSSVLTSALAMPGPVDPARLLALELKDGALLNASGDIMAAAHLASRKSGHAIAKAA